MRYPEKVESRSNRIPDVRYPEKVERRPDRIPDVRYPGGMSENFRPGVMAQCHGSLKLNLTSGSNRPRPWAPRHGLGSRIRVGEAH